MMTHTILIFQQKSRNEIDVVVVVDEDVVVAGTGAAARVIRFRSSSSSLIISSRSCLYLANSSVTLTRLANKRRLPVFSCCNCCWSASSVVVGGAELGVGVLGVVVVRLLR